MRFAIALQLALSIGALSAACGSADPNGTVQAQATAPVLAHGTPPQNLLNAYLTLQIKLTRDEVSGARAAFGTVLTAARVPALTIAPDARSRIVAAAEAGGRAADLAAQRAAFGTLSAALLAWLGVQENPLSEGLSVVFCPMAFDGKGAKWLQRGKQIQNPYFGAEMLSCGVVDATLAPGKKL